MTNRTPFQQALLDSVSAGFSDIPSENQIEITVSETFLNNCGKLLQRSRQGSVYSAGNVIRRGILIAAIIAVLATSVLAIPKVREGLIGFLASNHEDWFEVDFDPDQAAAAPDKLETVYHVTYVPAGYANSGVGTSATGITYHWCEETGSKAIVFVQSTIPRDNNSAFNTEGAKVERLQVDGYEAYRIRSAETLMYIWTDNAYLFYIRAHKELGDQEIQKMIESIEVDQSRLVQ